MEASILIMELALPTPPKRDSIGANSWLLRASASFPDRVVWAFGKPGAWLRESLPDLHADLKPLEGGGFQLELGAILAERLPGPKDELEYVVTIAGTRASSGTFCLSNAMNMIRYRRDGIDRHAICPASATTELLKDGGNAYGSNAHVEFLPSFVTARYQIHGLTPKEALSASLEGIVDDFIGGINNLVAAHVVSIDTQKMGILMPVYDRGSFPWVYLLLRGRDDEFRAQRLATSLLRTTLIPFPYEAARWELFQKQAAGGVEADVALKALRNAESYVQAGAYDFALLLSAVAVEVATSRFINARLRAGGVSGQKLREVESDLTFNIMLNTLVVTLAPDDQKPNIDLLGQINRLRRLRNDFMHYGKFSLTRLEIVGLTNAATEYLDYLSRIRLAAHG